jgi:hypothetical protein
MFYAVFDIHVCIMFKDILTLKSTQILVAGSMDLPPRSSQTQWGSLIDIITPEVCTDPDRLKDSITSKFSRDPSKSLLKPCYFCCIL